MAHLWVVVGASRGFGLELWRRVLEVDTHSHVALFSRSPIADVPDSERISFTSLDLADMDSLESTFLGALTKLQTPWERVTLVLVAAVLGPLIPVRKMELSAVQQTINTNLTSRFTLSKVFFDHFASVKAKTLVDISSGVRSSGGENWGLYCCTKAANVILLESLSKEQPESRVLSYSPGIMRTQMQEEISQSSDSGFKSFLGQVLDANKEVPVKESVNFLLQVLKEDTFESGAFIDIYTSRGPPLG